MKSTFLSVTILLVGIFIPSVKNCSAQDDTLRVMVYNTLHFGDGCQGTQAFLDGQLKKIVKYTNSDLIGLDKVQAIKLTNADPYGISPVWFADSIASQALNAAYPGRYAYCTLTDDSKANDNDMSVLFYNKNKLHFLTVKPLYVGQEDIDLFRLYYKDPNLSTTHDTTYLYVVLCHTISGTSSAGRDGQATTVIDSLKRMFTHLPNVIYMGDFNTHNSTEAGYKLITQATDTNYLFYDPPFHPDSKLIYPIDWQTNPNQAPSQLTTCTRAGSNPNSCGNNNGAYSWFDHIFLSRNIIYNYDYIRYIPNTWKSLGNDGNRIGIDINDSSTIKNTSAPSSVINAEWQFSDKYPVIAELGVTYNKKVTTEAISYQIEEQNIRVNNPVRDEITIFFPSSMSGEKANTELYDICGRLISAKTFSIINSMVKINANLTPGIYLLQIQSGKVNVTKKIVKQ